MPDIQQDALSGLSAALVERARLAQPLVARIEAEGRATRSGILWRRDVVVASEQGFPDVAEVKVTLVEGGTFAARLAGRDPGTNVVALRLDGTPDPARLRGGGPAPRCPRPRLWRRQRRRLDAARRRSFGRSGVAQPSRRPHRPAHHPRYGVERAGGGRARARRRRGSARHVDPGAPPARPGHSERHGRGRARPAPQQRHGSSGGGSAWRFSRCSCRRPRSPRPGNRAG